MTSSRQPSRCSGQIGPWACALVSGHYGKCRTGSIENVYALQRMLARLSMAMRVRVAA